MRTFRRTAALRTTRLDGEATLPATTPMWHWLSYLLIVITVLTGLTGHDPWKQDETYVFGIVQHILESGDWVVPTVAGEPFMEKPPLYYWVASSLAWAFSSILPLHDGARMASGLFMGVTCLACCLTARRMWGREAGPISVLILLGCLGSLLYSHLMVTDLAVMTGFALCLAAFPYACSRPATAGLLLGIGVGAGFLGKGLLLPGVVGISCLLLPAVFPAWRKRTYVTSLIIALIVSLPAFLVWPTLLYQRSPMLFEEWFWMNNVGRFLGFSVAQLGAPHRPGYWWEVMPWFAFPALPMAAASLWQRRRDLMRDQHIQCLITTCGVYMLTLSFAASAREAYALPLLVGLALLAAPTIWALSRRVNVAWAGLSICGFGMVAFLIWVVWVVAAAGHPPDWEWLNRLIPIDSAGATAGYSYYLAALLTISAVVLVRHAYFLNTAGLTIWVTGLTLCWGLMATLWMPWIDSAKSYRQVFQSMARVLPKEQGCIASAGLGESERAMLHYILGIDTARFEIVGDQGCRWILIEGLTQFPPHYGDSRGFQLLWEGARPRDTREHFWLFGIP